MFHTDICLTQQQNTPEQYTLDYLSVFDNKFCVAEHVFNCVTGQAVKLANINKQLWSTTN